MWKTKWLKHPEYPEFPILVCRSKWGWFFKNRTFATDAEVEFYNEYCLANKKYPYVP